MGHLAFAGPSTARNLAVLCGWGGGKFKNVAKYETLWHQIGWRTATIEMSMDMTFYPSSWTPIDAIARTVASECRRHREQEGPTARLIAHSFSNGGTFMQLALMAEDVHFDGAVYDSAPSRFTRLLPAGAPFISTATGKPKSEMLLDIARHTPFAVAATLAVPFIDTPPPLGRFEKLFTPESNAPRPELFVYSSTDAIIPPRHVESFIALRKRHGCYPIHTLGPLANSPHCGHGRTYPLEYAEAIERFASAVVAEQEGFETTVAVAERAAASGDA